MSDATTRAIERMKTAAEEAMREADGQKSYGRASFCEGQASGLRAAIRMLEEERAAEVEFLAKARCPRCGDMLANHDEVVMDGEDAPTMKCRKPKVREGCSECNGAFAENSYRDMRVTADNPKCPITGATCVRYLFGVAS